MGWRDAPLAQPEPVVRPDYILRPGSTPPQRRPPAADAGPAWTQAPLAESSVVEQPATDPVAPPEPLSWTDVPGKALENAPSSALEFGKAVVQPILHPIDTAKGIFDIGYGLASKLHGAVGGAQDPAQKGVDEAAANAVGEHFSKRYGTTDGFKQALASDPVGVIADAAMVLMGGGAATARVPGAVGRVGEVARAAGSAIDPLNNAGRAVSATGTAAANALGVITGAGTRPFQEAFSAGRQASPAFRENMRGKADITDVVDVADRAVAKMGQDRSAAYAAGMQATNASTNAVNTTPVFKIINDARKMAYYQGIPRSAEAVEVVNKVDQVVTNFAQLPGRHTAERFDAMKQAVGEIRQKTQQGTLERKIADSVYHGIKAQIVKQVPDYAKTMKDYQAASDTIGEARRALSINDRAATDTTLRKLQSTMRDGVSTNYGARAKLLDELATHEPGLPAALAGQSLSAWAPRGLARYAAGTGAMTGAVTNPASLGMLPLASPRLMGEVAHGAGRGIGGIDALAGILGITPQMLAAMARSGYVANTLTEPHP